MNRSSFLRLFALGVTLLCAAVWFQSEQREAERAETTRSFLENPGFTRDWSRERLEGVEERTRPPGPPATVVRAN